MAMLQSMTKDAGEPKGSPAGKAAPAEKLPGSAEKLPGSAEKLPGSAEKLPAAAGKTSPEAIRAGMHLTGNQGAQLDKIVLAGKRVMFDAKTHKMFLEQLDGPGTIAQKLGQGVAGLMGLLWQESRQSLPPQLLIPAGMVLVAVAADFLRKGGMDVSDEDVAGGIEALVTALLQAGGVDPEKVAQIGERGGKSDGTMPVPEIPEGEA